MWQEPQWVSRSTGFKYRDEREGPYSISQGIHMRTRPYACCYQLRKLLRHLDYSMSFVHLLVFQALLQTSVRCIVLRNGIPVSEHTNDFTAHNIYQNIHTEGSSNVSSWETHVQHLVMCENRSLDDLTHGKWYRSDQGHYLYEPDTCQLHRISGELARRCEKVLAFLTPYQTKGEVPTGAHVCYAQVP